jgi:TPR repeat protein
MPDPSNPLLTRVRDALAGTHDLLGELGVDEHGEVLYLARELAGGALVGVSLRPEGPECAPSTVEVRRTLGETVTVRGSSCPECGTELPDLARFCLHCGADLSGVLATEGSPEADRLLHALVTATTGRYDILGRMDHEGRSGTVYFARDLSTGRIIALRLRRAEAGDGVQAEYVARQTAVFRTPLLPELPVMPPARSNEPTAAAAPPPPDQSVEAMSADGEPSGLHADADAPALPAPPARSRGAPLPALVGAVALLLVAGYFALRDPATSTIPVATAPPPDTASIAAGPDSGDLAVPDSDTGSATRIPRVDSGTVRIAAVLPANARVTVDGMSITGRSVRLPVGSYQMAVIARGYRPFTQRVTVRAGADVSWSPRLVSTAVASAETAPPPPDTQVRARETPTCGSAMRTDDWANAFTLCTAEANAGGVAAASHLGRLYARGQGTNRDLAQAFAWYSKAAQGGDRDAQTAIGYALRDGVGAKRDQVQSVKWFKQAAEAGDRSAQLEYAVALEKGDGTARDERSAREWYRKSADQGNFMAARRLGKMMERGAGGSRSESEAAVAYERAGSLGDGESALLIGRWYRDGKGVAKSREKALEWFRKAAELGNAEARDEVKRMERGG